MSTFLRVRNIWFSSSNYKACIIQLPSFSPSLKNWLTDWHLGNPFISWAYANWFFDSFFPFDLNIRKWDHWLPFECASSQNKKKKMEIGYRVMCLWLQFGSKKHYYLWLGKYKFISNKKFQYSSSFYSFIIQITSLGCNNYGTSLSVCSHMFVYIHTHYLFSFTSLGRCVRLASVSLACYISYPPDWCPIKQHHLASTVRTYYRSWVIRLITCPSWRLSRSRMPSKHKG